MNSCRTCMYEDLREDEQPCKACSEIAKAGENFAMWRPKTEAKGDAVDHPVHYNSHPSGVECIDIIEHYDFCTGNAIKYLWRAGLKGDNALEDFKKAKWYIERKIKQLEKGDKE